MTMRMNQASPSADDSLRLGINLEHIYLFDRDGLILR